MWEQIAGAAVGALLAGKGSKQAGSTTVTNDLPEWLKKYAVGNLDMAGPLRDRLAGSGTDLLDASSNELLKTISGGYLSPASNPFLADYGRILTENIGSAVDSRFSGAGRYGSGAHQGVLGKGIGDALTQLYGGAYGAERGRMYGGALAAPGFMQGGVQAQFQPFVSFASLFPNASTQTQPYFQNPGANMLSGALLGAGLGNIFGGGGKPVLPDRPLDT
jgi:hypothetical protein